MIQHTIQLVPRLPEPTLVTAVLVEPNVLVKRGQPLFQFDRKPYEVKVRHLEAELAAAKQHVKVLLADVDLTGQKEAHAKASLNFQNYFVGVQKDLGKNGVIPTDQVQLSIEQQKLAQAGYDQAVADALSARIKAESEIEGMNTPATLKEVLGCFTAVSFFQIEITGQYPSHSEHASGLGRRLGHPQGN